MIRMGRFGRWTHESIDFVSMTGSSRDFTQIWYAYLDEMDELMRSSGLSRRYRSVRRELEKSIRLAADKCQACSRDYIDLIPRPKAKQRRDISIEEDDIGIQMMRLGGAPPGLEQLRQAPSRHQFEALWENYAIQFERLGWLLEPLGESYVNHLKHVIEELRLLIRTAAQYREKVLREAGHATG